MIECGMDEAVNIAIPRALYDELRTVADSQGSSPEEVISEALRWYVAAGAEYERAVLEDIRAADAGEIISHKAFLADLQKRLKRAS
jgi:predicted transcriptional regulator